MDWEMPVSKYTGMGKAPESWRKIVCCLASVVMDWSSSWALGLESRWGRKP
jgi:hypothetical protein